MGNLKERMGDYNLLTVNYKEYKSTDKEQANIRKEYAINK